MPLIARAAGIVDILHNIIFYWLVVCHLNFEHTLILLRHDDDVMSCHSSQGLLEAFCTPTIPAKAFCYVIRLVKRGPTACCAVSTSWLPCLQIQAGHKSCARSAQQHCISSPRRAHRYARNRLQGLPLIPRTAGPMIDPRLRPKQTRRNTKGAEGRRGNSLP